MPPPVQSMSASVQSGEPARKKARTDSAGHGASQALVSSTSGIGNQLMRRFSESKDIQAFCFLKLPTETLANATSFLSHADVANLRLSSKNTNGVLQNPVLTSHFPFKATSRIKNALVPPLTKEAANSLLMSALKQAAKNAMQTGKMDTQGDINVSLPAQALMRVHGDGFPEELALSWLKRDRVALPAGLFDSESLCRLAALGALSHVKHLSVLPERHFGFYGPEKIDDLSFLSHMSHLKSFEVSLGVFDRSPTKEELERHVNNFGEMRIPVSVCLSVNSALNKVTSLVELESLKIMTQYTNYITDQCFFDLSALKKLKHLSLDTDLYVKGNGLSLLRELEQLESLHLKAVHLEKPIDINQVSTVLSKLKTLKIGHHALKLVDLSKLTQLEVLSLGVITGRSAVLFEQLTALSNLQELELAGNSHSTLVDGMEKLNQLPALKKLKLQSYATGDPVFTAGNLDKLSSHTTLEDLTLSFPHAVDYSEIYHCFQIPKLKKLTLSSSSPVQHDGLTEWLGQMSEIFNIEVWCGVNYRDPVLIQPVD